VPIILSSSLILTFKISDILLTLLLVHAAYSESPSEPEYANIDVEVESAQWGSMGCSSSCGCRQRCAMVWWMPCNCPVSIKFEFLVILTELFLVTYSHAYLAVDVASKYFGWMYS